MKKEKQREKEERIKKAQDRKEEEKKQKQNIEQSKQIISINKDKDKYSPPSQLITFF
jgi:hypothetical protein